MTGVQTCALPISASGRAGQGLRPGGSAKAPTMGRRGRMNDIEVSIYGWKMRIMEVKVMLHILENNLKEYEGCLKFWEDRLKDENKGVGT